MRPSKSGDNGIFVRLFEERLSHGFQTWRDPTAAITDSRTTGDKSSGLA